MPTYITPDLVPPVLALPTGSRRGTWALAGPPRGPRSPTAAGATRAPLVLTLRLIRTTPAWHPPHARCLRLMRGGLTVQSNCTAAFFSPIETTTPTRRIPVARRFPSFPAALRRK